MRTLQIAQAGSRYAKEWPFFSYTWDSFITKLKNPIVSVETMAEYFSYSKARRGQLKDVGGFVGGTFANNKRSAKNVMGRDLVTLDLDNIPTDKLDGIIKGLACQTARYIVYSTRSHTKASPRIRVILELDKTVNAEQYEPIARMAAKVLGLLEYCDPSTFEAARLMYFPSVCKDGEYLFRTGGASPISADGILSMYEDWREVSKWPRLAPMTTPPKLANAKQADPEIKKGIVGAFCRVYGITEAIENYLTEIYTEHEGGRFTYANGSTVGGAVVYDDKFLYSHHATDPASGKLCNAFDLVRIHLFGEKDEQQKEDTPTTKLPSFIAMTELAMADSRVNAILSQERLEERQEQITAVYKATEPKDEESQEWRKSLRYHKHTGEALPTIANVCLIILNDPRLRGKIRYNEFSSRLEAVGALPWNDSEEIRDWGNVDDAGLRQYLESTYLITGKDKIEDGLVNACQRNKVNPLKQYIKSVKWDKVPRIDSCLCDFLGCDNNAYTREASRKFFCAAVARALGTAVKFDNMIILSGPQGTGKSTFVRKLGADWFSDSLQTFIGKEASEVIQGVWINEIPELHSFARVEVNAIKQFLSKQEDIFREPYARRTEKRPRTCVFVGTTNDTEYLKDHTGNRRFWPIDIDPSKARLSIFADLTAEYVHQLWAEALERWQDGEPLFLSKFAEIKAEEVRKQHEETNAKQGIIEEYLQTPLPLNWDKMNIQSRRMYLNGDGDYIGETVPRRTVCTAEIWCECLGQDLRYMGRKDQIEINKMLDKIPGWVKKAEPQRMPLYGIQRIYVNV